MTNNPRPRITTVAYHVALWPVVLGILIVLIWYFKRFSWLPPAGAYLMYVYPLNLTIAVFLIVRWKKNSRLPKEDRVNSRYFSIPLLALALNYYVAFLCIVAGVYIGNQAKILIVNNSSYRLEDIRAQGPSGARFDFPSIEPNDKASISIDPRGEGEVTVSLTANGREIVANPIGYWIWGSETTTLIIDNDLGHRVGREGEPQGLDSSFLEDNKI